MEIILEGEDPEDEEKGESHPGPCRRLSYPNQYNPQEQKNEEKGNPSLEAEGKFKMAYINPNRVSKESGNKR